MRSCNQRLIADMAQLQPACLPLPAVFLPCHVKSGGDKRLTHSQLSLLFFPSSILILLCLALGH